MAAMLHASQTRVHLAPGGTVLWHTKLSHLSPLAVLLPKLALVGVISNVLARGDGCYAGRLRDAK